MRNNEKQPRGAIAFLYKSVIYRVRLLKKCSRQAFG